MSNYLKSNQISAKGTPKQHSFSMCILRSLWFWRIEECSFLIFTRLPILFVKAMQENN